jgi:hypothetical protein
MFFLSNCLPSDIVDIVLIDVVVMERSMWLKKEESICPRVEAKKYISSRIGILAHDDTPLNLHFASTFKIPESGVNRRVSGEWRRGNHAGQASTSSNSMHDFGLFVQSLHRDSDLVVS